MLRLISAAAVASALLVSTAQAQSVSDDVLKQLWCGTAFVVAYGSIPPDAPSEYLAQVEPVMGAGNALIDQATQAHLDAGFTQEAVDKVKADLVTEITPIVSDGGDPSTAKYSFDECVVLLPTDIQAMLASPADPSAM